MDYVNDKTLYNAHKDREWVVNVFFSGTSSPDCPG